MRSRPTQPASDRPQPLPPAALLKAVRRLLRPLVRLLMRSGVTYPIVADLLRSLFVEVAAKELLLDTKARTDSRLSLLTGVHRKEIRRLRELPPDTETVPEVVTLSSQIIARWLGTRTYIDSAGRPKPLPRMPGRDTLESFEGLIASVTTDVRPRAVLDDWLSQGIVSLDADDVVRLEATAFIPRAGGEEQLFYFARNLHDHVAAAAANVGSAGPARFLDRSLHYDLLTPEAAARLEAYAREAGVRVLLEANRLALELVGDEAAAREAGPTQRLNFGIYVFSEDEPPTPEPTA
jgi:hypothetical protein